MLSLDSYLPSSAFFFYFNCCFFVASCLITKAAGNSFLPGNWNQNKSWASPQTNCLLQGLETLGDCSYLLSEQETAGLLLPLSLQVWAPVSSKQPHMLADLGREGALQTRSVLSPLLTCTGSDLVVSVTPIDLNKLNGLQVHACFVIPDFCFHCFLPKFCSEL